MTWLKRFMRHVWMSPLIARRAFTEETLRAIEAAVATCEQTHRGQVRFVVEAELHTHQLWAGLTSRARALEVFSGLRVWDTEENNGVLIYVLLADRKVEIIADRGIHAKVGTERWRAICKEMELNFRKGDFREGSVNAIHKVGVELAFYFPPHGQLTNEQSDKPVML
ncbi:MAG: TPM domain-containing protein [Rhodocyclaceae bacterium]|nr:TPM domain-containing protein [Rhodocyclaceae bacterium]